MAIHSPAFSGDDCRLISFGLRSFFSSAVLPCEARGGGWWPLRGNDRYGIIHRQSGGVCVPALANGENENNDAIVNNVICTIGRVGRWLSPMEAKERKEKVREWQYCILSEAFSQRSRLCRRQGSRHGAMAHAPLPGRKSALCAMPLCRRKDTVWTLRPMASLWRALTKPARSMPGRRSSSLRAAPRSTLDRPTG